MSVQTIKPIVLLSGPVGAGKTTLAKEMIKSAVDPMVYIEGDKFWFFIVKGGESVPNQNRPNRFAAIKKAV